MDDQLAIMAFWWNVTFRSHQMGCPSGHDLVMMVAVMVMMMLLFETIVKKVMGMRILKDSKNIDIYVIVWW